jgi:hypothetical protein
VEIRIHLLHESGDGEIVHWMFLVKASGGDIGN